ncbi:MAG: DNA replication and repair protein RecF, partial [Pseudomonadota bacterium]
FLDRIAMSFRPGHAEAAIQYEKTMRERNRLLKEDVRDPRWYGALEAQMARAGAEIELNRAHAIARLTAAQESAGGGASPSAFPRAHLALEHPDGDPPVPDPDAPWEDAAHQLSAHFAAALARGRDRDRAAGRSLTGPHRSDLAAIYAAKDQPARLCSTGEQKALLISLVLANARALAEATGAAPLLLLDEVAAHLDDGRRASLYAEITALGAQVWMTGTGPELFADFPGAALRLRVEESSAGSRLHPEPG